MADEQIPANVLKRVKMKWENLERVPILFSNQALIQNIQNEFIITFGQVTGPLFTEKPTNEELAAIDSVSITPIFRIAMTPDRLVELIGALELNYRNFQKRELDS